MGGWNAALMLAAAALYIAPVAACPHPIPEALFAVCATGSDRGAAVLYKLYAVPFFLAVQLIAFQDGTDRRANFRVALILALALVPAALILHLPYFLFPGSLVYRHPDEMIAFDLFFLFLFLAWAACHRMAARWAPLWRRLDPTGATPPADRHRALFWHPTIALFFHQMAASTDQLAITWP
ncbi:MAG: hypothetical protein NXI21_19375 [Alphaproteobacteria bacterium]|nr:hypothetical protein [Alphaproteobacteria bacterium]